MSHGAPMPDAAAHVEGKECRRKTHSGPRKRRPKKKQVSCSSNGSLTPERSRDGNIQSIDDVLQDPTKSCATAAPLTSSPHLIRHIESPSSTSESSPGTEQLFRRVQSSVNTSSCTLTCSSRAPTLSTLNHSTFSTEEKLKLRREEEKEATERAYWTQWVIEAAEKERTRRLNVLKQLQCEEEEEVQRRRRWAIATIEKEQEAMMREMFLDNMKNTQWFQTTISRFSEDYEVVCPNSWFGCTFSCMLKDLESHLEICVYRQVPDTLDRVVEDTRTDFYSYDVVCPNALLGCKEICSRENLAEHLTNCPVNGISREKEWEERLEWRQNVIQATEKERARRMDEERAHGRAYGGELSFGNLQRLYEEQTAMMQVVLHDEIVDFYDYHQREARKKRPWMQKAIAMVTEEIILLWNHNVRVECYGSFATKLHGEASDVDLVVFGATEEFNCTGQQCVKALADHFHALSSFVHVSAITHASIPLLKVVVLVTSIVSDDKISNNNNSEGGESVAIRIPFDITFDEPHSIHHNGVASVTMVQGLANAFYGLRELTFVLKHFLVKRGLNDPYVGGLSSYGLLLMVVYVLQEQDALISIDGQKVWHDPKEEEEDEEEPNSRAPPSNTRCNMRYESQCLKGELLAKKIITQCFGKQQPKKTNGSRKRGFKRPEQVVLPYFVIDSKERGEPEPKPYLLGKLLMDFLQFYGDDFRQNLDVISIVAWNDSTLPVFNTSPPVKSMSPSLSPSPCHVSPPGSHSRSNSPLPVSPLSHDGLLVIEDPLQPTNNVGKTCYRVSQVFRDFSDFLSFLTALIVRGSVMTVGKKKKIDTATKSSSSPPSSTSSAAHEPMCRILRSVFEMKTR
ncbi:hypothetical protein PsorP6_011148 [Peronosclerospora sorghi]|uniref:Uncharacterized protein n=1 Tax=Peronosclerospora sorghi TaxID=230839 RepID=A0ACC0VWR2_9STRA|nr:hypothetical protein PsorP6_011148 [Peronosclerospora sorghi]